FRENGAKLAPSSCRASRIQSNSGRMRGRSFAKEQRMTRLFALLALTACTDAGLQPKTEDVDKVDDQLEVDGQYCTDAPDEVAFPVKLLIALDKSASLQCTDPYNVRINAVSAVGTSLDALPNVEFSILGFASWSRITPFEPDWSSKDIQGELSASGGTATDYQGALSTILTVLEQDMIESGPAEVARTK